MSARKIKRKFFIDKKKSYETIDKRERETTMRRRGGNTLRTDKRNRRWDTSLAVMRQTTKEGS